MKFEHDGIRDFEGVLYKIKARSDRVSDYLYAEICKEKDFLDNFPGPIVARSSFRDEREFMVRALLARPAQHFQEDLLRALNDLITRPGLYDAQRFQNVYLSPEVRTLLTKQNEPGKLCELNYWLIASAYPDELQPRPRINLPFVSPFITPFNRAVKSAFRYNSFHEAFQRQGDFNALSEATLSSEQRNTIKYQVYYQETKLAQVRISWNIVAYSFSLIAAFLWVGLTLCMPLLFRTNGSEWANVSYFLFLGVPWGLAIVVRFVQTTFAVTETSEISRQSPVVPIFLGFAIAYQVLASSGAKFAAAIAPGYFHGSSKAYNEVFVGLKMASISLWTGVGIFTMLLLTASQYVQWRRNRFADAVIVHDLIKILTLIDRAPEDWNRFEYKRKVVAKVDALADRFEYSLFWPYNRNASAPSWQSEAGQRMANAIRSLEKWILTSKADTRDYFIARIRDLLMHACLGEWDSIEQLPAEPSDQTKSFYLRTVDFLQAVFVGGLPLAGILLYQKLSGSQGKIVPTYILGSAVLWAVLTILAKLDTNLSAKVALFKDAAQILPLPGKKSG